MQIQQYRTALRLIHQTNFSNNAIARTLSISPNTVKKCRTLSDSNQWAWTEIQDLDDVQLEAAMKQNRHSASGKVMPDWATIHRLMQEKHQTLMQIWDEYRETHQCNAYSYSQFTHYYRQFLKRVDICMRQIHYAGETVFVDYAGKTISYFDSASGEERRAQVFVAVLGCSNYTFAWASPSQKLEDWIEAHNRMLVFFGGAPAVIVPDNLKSAVTTPGRNLLLNKTYEDLAEHYGCVVVPARVRRPKDKSKAETGVKLITQWISMPLSRRRFFSVEEINEAIAELLVKFNNRPFKRLPGSRLSRFEEMDKPALKPLPVEPFEFAEWTGEQKVGPDYHVYIKNHAYSVPYSLVGRKVAGRVSARAVEIYCAGRRVALHLRDDTPGEATTDPHHRPASHQAYATLSLDHFTQWANKIGIATKRIVEAQFEGRPDHSLLARKACSNLQRLAKQYGNERLESACTRALRIQSPTVKSVRSVLQHNLDETTAQASLSHTHSRTQIPSHVNVRGSDYYAGGRGNG